ncbi:hypothetical protein CFI10_16835 [Marinobacterium iners]|jgi:hypothetical protein|uniref:hypothetical protein n=1 Tax=Marinobacterium iners TaxID=48076 RepID=UPI001A8DC08A|nr:hypothetical protein [Marinobacterium iners]QSR36617.1 hypothetical protein CFI10_16835 [Marinobacterium iners]
MELTEVAEQRVPALGRLTTVYHPLEDRVRISGQVSSDDVVVIWVTRRLMDRMVPALVEWLEQQDADVPRADLLQSVKQTRAINELTEQTRQEGSTPVSAENAGTTWLAASVDVQRRPEQLVLIFKAAPDAGGQQAALPLRALALRQWLNILLQAYSKAEWSTAVWPEWMREQLPELASPARGAIH